jgi:small-conductance mechanosensitive channel
MLDDLRALKAIQVGDYVEVGGLWAEVKKINVRSTVVHTFDNASVIIPNSEFISQQVTNWSFRDKPMRRNLEVGVAHLGRIIFKNFRQTKL